MFHETFLSLNQKKNDIIVSGGFLYVTPDNLLRKTIKKMFSFMRKNSYLIIWDYDTPTNYNNKWKYHKGLKSYKRDLLKELNKIDKKLYLVSKQLRVKGGLKLDFYDDKINLDNIFAVMIFKKII